jgi:hypothetical protein
VVAAAAPLRDATRVMMLCPDYGLGAEQWVKFLYLGGDAVAFLGHEGPLRIMRAPIIASPP